MANKTKLDVNKTLKHHFVCEHLCQGHVKDVLPAVVVVHYQ